MKTDFVMTLTTGAYEDIMNIEMCDVKYLIQTLFACRSNSSPATEIWQQMQLQKKVEANEGGVSRVG